MQNMGILRDSPEAVFDGNDTTAQACVESQAGWFTFFLVGMFNRRTSALPMNTTLVPAMNAIFTWNNAGKGKGGKRNEHL